jgi:hypothetical protein
MNPESGLSAPEPKPGLCHQLPVKSLLLHLEISSYASYAFQAVLGVTQVTRTVSPLITLNQSPCLKLLLQIGLIDLSETGPSPGSVATRFAGH